MKKFLLTLVSGLFAVVAWSATYNIVSVDLSDGTKVDIALSDKLSFSFNATHLLVSGIDSDFEIPKEKIVAFSHSAHSGLNEVATDSTVDIEGRIVHFKDLADGTVISIYNMSGNCLRSVITGGDYLLKLEELPAAVYIVKVNNVSYKISLK